ncbi:unnamed protein product, partial [marine sediment metagenome]
MPYIFWVWQGTTDKGLYVLNEVSPIYAIAILFMG